MSEGRVIEPADLELAPGTEGPTDLDIRAARTRAERQVIQVALTQSNGVIATAAKLLGISRPTLYGLLEEHGIGTTLGPSGEHEVPPSSHENQPA